MLIYLSMIDDYDDRYKFARVYATYKDLMLNRALDILKDHELAEDAVHNAFLKIIKNIDKIDDVNNLRTQGFCVVVVDNIAKTMYNKEHKVKFIELTDMESDVNVAEIIEDKNVVENLMARMNDLPDIYRYVFVLKYFNNLSDRDIAETLNLNISTVRKRLQRGKKLLKNLLKRGEDNE